MNKRMISLMAAALALLSASGQVEFTGYGEYRPIEITLSDNHTSLNKIYVVYDTDGVRMSVNSSTGEPATWESYTYRNGNLVIEPVSDIRWNGMSTTLDKIIPNTGYKIQEGNNAPYYCWVVNYADYYLELNDMFINNELPCNLLTFNIDGHGDAIPYYDIDGRRQVLDREIELVYNDLTLVWSDSIHGSWEQKEVVENFVALDQGVEITPPLCDTEFRLSGDRFLREWGIEEVAIEDVYFYTQAVNCNSVAVLIDHEGKTTKLEGGLTGGSAPAHLVFTGYPSDAVVYREWEMATDPDFENVILQFNQDEVDYTLSDAGTYYMRYMVANASGSCEAYGETYIISVSESELECPNVFSPGSTPGVNDVWKVHYKSLVEFHCWIFNRWGNLVCEFTDPSSGWDGTYHGKLVDTGVYFYVVTATGSDGVKYKKRGDISILRYKKGAAGTSSDVTGGTGF